MKTKPWFVGGFLLSSALALGWLSYDRWVGRLDLEKKETARKNDEEKPADPVAGGEGFPFPADSGGKLLAQLLMPAEEVSARMADRSVEPRTLPDRVTRNSLDFPLPPLEGELPRIPPGPPVPPIRPWLLPENPPWSRFQFDPLLPEERELPVSPGVRVPSPDIEQPMPLPILAQGPTDPAPLDDPTTSVSAVLALTAVPPVRTTPAPFLRLALPDPFEHHHAVRSTIKPAEEKVLGIAPRLPGR